MKERLQILSSDQRSVSEKSRKNIYGKEVFVPELAANILRDYSDRFRDYFRSLGYREEVPVNISSGIDPTVRFIGSHISVFKPYLEQNNTPDPGIFMVQGCIRTRNVPHIFNDNFFPKWGSYFPSFGVMVPPERLSGLFKDSLAFLEEVLEIKKEHLRIRVSASDADLMEVCQQLGLTNLLEVDTQPPTYYQHKIGMDGVRGRNLNIAVQNTKTEDFSDIGNIIVIENETKTLGVELAIGETTTIKELYGLDHVLDCHPVVGLENVPILFRRKLEDAILVSTTLFREGLRPNGSDNRGRLLRTYVRSISYLRAKIGISIEALSNLIASFEKREFSSTNNLVSAEIISYLVEFEGSLKSGKQLSDEEKIIASTHLQLR